MTVTLETKIAVMTRARGKCEACGGPIEPRNAQFHHCHIRSQYRGSDRDEAWNLAYVHPACHRRAHQERAERERLERQADARKPPEARATKPVRPCKLRAAQRKKGYKRALNFFKRTHEGRTPLQEKRHRAEAWKKKKG